MEVTWAWTSVKPSLGQLCIGPKCHGTSRTWWQDVGYAKRINKSSTRAIVATPWQKVGNDIITLYGKGYQLVHYFCKFSEMCHLDSKTASSVVVNIKFFFARHGIPEELVGDNMPFNSDVMKTFAEHWNFIATSRSPHYPQVNAHSERAIQTIRRLLKKAEEIVLVQYCKAQFESPPSTTTDKPSAENEVACVLCGPATNGSGR